MKVIYCFRRLSTALELLPKLMRYNKYFLSVSISVYFSMFSMHLFKVLIGTTV